MRPPIAPPSATPYLVAVVAGAMAFLTVCALEAGRGAAQVAGFWQGDLRGVATVRLPHDAALEPVLAALGGVDGVETARALTQDEVAALLLPWLGTMPAPDAVPLPQIVDVQLADPPPAAAAVEAVLPTGGVYDDHRAWTAPLLEAARGFERLIAAAVGLSAVALRAMVAVAARAGLAGAAGTVSTLRLLGARDGFIAAAFDRGIAVRAALGAALGAGSAILLLRAVPGVAAGTTALWLLLAVPLATGALAWLTARLSIMLMLRAAP